MGKKKRNKIMEYLNEPFIAEYWQQLRRNPSLRWKGFIGRMKNFALILEKKYRVTFDKTDYSNVVANPAFQEVSKLVSETDPKKPKSLVRHDCFHLLLVDMLRSNAPAEDLVPKYWFVTRDKNICLAEQMRLIIEKKKGVERKPSSVLIDVWLHMISPFLSPKLATHEAPKIFAQIFSTHFLPSFPQMKPKFLIKILRPLLDQTDLKPYQIKALVSDIFLAEHVSALSRTGKLPFYLNKKLIEIQEGKHKEELHRIQTEKNALAEQLKKSEKETRDLRTKIELRKQFEKYLAGALIFFIVWAITYFAVLLPTVKEPFSAFFFAIIIALIFGFLLGFQRYEWILEKILTTFRPSK